MAQKPPLPHRYQQKTQYGRTELEVGRRYIARKSEYWYHSKNFHQEDDKTMKQLPKKMPKINILDPQPIEEKRIS